MSDDMKIGNIVFGLGFDPADVTALEARLAQISGSAPTIRVRTDDTGVRASAQNYSQWWNQALRERATVERQVSQAAQEQINQVRLAQARANLEYERGMSSGSWVARNNAAAQYQRSMAGVVAEINRINAAESLTVRQTTELVTMESQINRVMAQRRTLSAGQAGLNAAGMGRLGNATMAASLVSPELGMVGMAAQAGPAAAGIAAVGLAVVGTAKFLHDGADKAAEFQRSLQQIGAISHASEADMNDYGTYIQKLSTDLPITTQKLAEMGREAVMVGMHGKEGMETYTKSMAALAIVTRDVDGNLGSTAGVGQEIAKILRSTGMTAEQVEGNFGKLTNALVGLKTESGVAIPEVTNLLKFWSSQGTHVGLTVQQMVALSAALIQTGARAQGAGGALATFFDKAAAAAAEGGDKLDAWAKVIGKSADETAKLLKTDPMEFLRAFVNGANAADRNGQALSLTLGSVSLNSQQVRRTMAELSKAMPLVDGNIKTANKSWDDHNKALSTAEKASDNYKDSQIKLSNAWDVFKTKAGAVFLPALTSINKELLAGVNLFSRWADGMAKAMSIGGSNADVAEANKHVNELQGQVDHQQKVVDRKEKGLLVIGAGSTQEEESKLKVLQAQLAVALKAQQAAQQAQIQTAVTNNVIAKPNTGGQGGTTAQYGDESGKYGTAFIESLVSSGSVKSNTKLQAWCADVAAKIQIELGNNLKYTASAGGLKQNALRAGYQQVSTADIKPGDMVFYHGPGYGGYGPDGKQSGNHVETALGTVNGKVRLIGTNDTSHINEKNIYDLQHATVLRSPNSPWANGGHPSESAVPAGPKPEHVKTAKELNAELVHQKALYAANKISLEEYHAAAERIRNQAEGLQKTQHEGSKSFQATDRVILSATAAMNTHARAAKDTSLTYAQWNKERAEATRLAKLESDLSDHKLTGDAGLRAKNEIDAYRKKGAVQAAALEEASRRLGDSDAKETQYAKISQERAKNNAELQKALSDGKIADAQRYLDKLKTNLQTELDLVGDNESRKARVIKSSGAAIIAAGDRIADLKRDQAVRQANSEAAEAKKVPGADTGAIEKLRVAQVQEAYKDAQAEKARNRAAEANSERDASARAAEFEKQKAKETQDIKAQIAKASRDLNLQLANQTTQALESSRQRELAGVKDDGQQRLIVEQHYGKLIYSARVAAIQVEYKNALTEAAQGEGQLKDQRIRLAKQTRDEAMAAAAADRDNRKNDAQDNVSDAVAKLRDQYHDLAESMREKIQAGKVEQGDLSTYLKKMGEIDQAATEAGLQQNALIQQAKASSEAVRQSGIDAAIASGGYGDMADGLTRVQDESGKAKASLDDVMGTLPSDSSMWDSTNKGWSDFIDNIEKLDKDGLLAAGTLQQVKEKVKDLQDALALDEGYNAAQSTIADIASDPSQYADGASDSQAAIDLQDARKASADELRNSLSSLDQETVKNADTLQNYSDALKSAADSGGITSDSLTELQGVLSLMEKAGDLLPEDFRQFSQYVREAGKDGKLSAQDFKDLNESLELLSKNANDTTDYSQYKDVTDGAKGVKAPDAAPSLEATQAQAKATQDQIDLDPKLKVINDDLEKQIQLWNEIIDGEVQAGAISEQQGKTLKDNLSKVRDNLTAQRELEDAIASNKASKLEQMNADAVRRHNFAAQREYISQKEALEIESAQRTFDRETAGLDSASPKYQLAQQKLENARTAANLAGVNARRALLQSELGNFQNWASAAAGIFKKLNGDQDNALSVLSDAVASGFSVAAKAASGDMVGAITEGIGAVMNLGDAIENMSPAFQKWKKNLLDIANLEKSAAGQKMIGGSGATGLNGLANPYYDQLQEDAANREKKANSHWYTRLIWGLFGGSPKTLKDDAAKTLAQASSVFNDFGSTVYSTMEDALLSAIQSGDFSNVNDVLSQSLDKFVQKAAVEAIIAKSNLTNMVKQLADDSAAGKDISADIAAIRAEENRIASSVQAIAPSLPGYGVSQQTSPTGSLVGNAPSSNLGVPQFNLSLPPEILTPLSQFTAVIPVFARAADKWDAVADRILAGNNSIPRLSNAGGLA